jgi:hypothetical protein
MTRTTLMLDRIATLLVAALLIATAALGIWWWIGDSPLPDSLDTSAIYDRVDEAWWPWASALAGVLLILIGLRWIAAHLASRKVKTLRLRGSGSTGKLEVAGSKAASAAADALTHMIGVRSASGRIERDRGQLVAHVVATVEPDADLALVAHQADVVSAQLAQVLGRDDLRCSVELKVATRAQQLPRVS